MRDWATTLQNELIIGDGAIGTLLNAEGVTHCYEALNCTDPDRVERIHSAYVQSGATLISTNTFAANYIKLRRYGLEDDVKKINENGVAIARRATEGTDAFVFGTIGGVRNLHSSSLTDVELKRSFREQLFALLEAGVDGLLFETFYDWNELLLYLTISKQETSLPIIANLSMQDVPYLQNGMKITEAFDILDQKGIDVIGINCRLGPLQMARAFEYIPLPTQSKLACYPNASLPKYDDGRVQYNSDEDYFAEMSELLHAAGVSVFGGCCGTRPEHIAAMRNALYGKKPVTVKKDVRPIVSPIIVQRTDEAKSPTIATLATVKRTIIAELDPPKQLSQIETFLQGAQSFADVGIDAITLADNSLASPRINNVAMASLIKERVGLRSLLHYTCRDHNLIGMQSQLLGMHALGFHEILALTGDPSKVGDFPGATDVFDLNSLDLIRLISGMNDGIGFSGKPLGGKTNFSISGAFNPNVKYMHKAVERIEKKAALGASYFLSQPVFSIEKLQETYDQTKHLKTPIYIGIMPLTGHRNAQFLHHEVPGISLSADVLRSMEQCGDDKIKGATEGIAIAKHLLDAACEMFSGIYLITPFLRYEMSVELAAYIKAKSEPHVERKILT
ncbi:MAG: bifunctional homocysteine S-methyltransferase/methylenetetrahydrofolate reductase [Bacilli bacterium]